MKTEDVLELLRDKYRGSEWAGMAEVPVATGAGAHRRCDYISMGLWPSQGLHLHGHEIKVSRSDWQKEIQDPAKASTFVERCHYWWIVAPKGVLELPELPATWGYIQASEKSLRVKKPATLNHSPELTHEFLASLMRAANQSSGVETRITKARGEGFKEGYEKGKEHGGYERGKRLKEREIEELRKAIDRFESTSGISIKSWDGPEMGETLKTLRLLASGRDQLDRSVRAARATLERFVELEQAVEMLPREQALAAD